MKRLSFVVLLALWVFVALPVAAQTTWQLYQTITGSSFPQDSIKYYYTLQNVNAWRVVANISGAGQGGITIRNASNEEMFYLRMNATSLQCYRNVPITLVTQQTISGTNDIEVVYESGVITAKLNGSNFCTYTSTAARSWGWRNATTGEGRVLNNLYEYYPATPTNTPTNTPTFTPTFTPTNTPSFTPTFTHTPTETLIPSATPTFTPTFTYTPTFTESPSETPIFTPTFTHTPTETLTPSATPTGGAYTATPDPALTVTASATFAPTTTPAATPDELITLYPGRYESNTGGIYRTGAWYATACTACLDNETITTVVNGQVHFRMYGDGLTIHRIVGPAYGDMEVCFNEWCQIISNTNAGELGSVDSTTLLRPGYYTVTIRNISVTDQWLALDAITIRDDSATYTVPTATPLPTATPDTSVIAGTPIAVGDTTITPRFLPEMDSGQVLMIIILTILTVLSASNLVLWVIYRQD